MSQLPEPELLANPWSAAVKLLTDWLENGERVDLLLERLPAKISGQDRARAQSLLFGTIRHFGRLSAHLYPLVSRPPRPRLRAILLVAGFEIIEGGDEHHLARVVHHAVEQAKTLASPAEARLVNAVVRKLGAAISAEIVPPKLASDEILAAYFSHPLWLVRRWLTQFGPGPTRQLLEWNQKPGAVQARWRRPKQTPNEMEMASLVPTSWENHYELRPGRWPEVSRLMEEGLIYLQDPSTRLAVQLLEPRAGETILDLCAAPGGKSVAIADALLASDKKIEGAPAGRVVSVDLPGSRIDRLKQNLGRIQGVDIALVQGDLEQGPSLFKLHELPQQYSAILIDVPCSNTGVMRHRVDVKWRLQENDVKKHSYQQLSLLSGASRLLGPRGRMVYSTCSLETEENEGVVNAFLEKSKGHYKLVKTAISRPWETGHDGAAAFLLERIG